MPETSVEIVEAYLSRMVEIRSTGAATSETSYYGALENLMNAVGRQLKPRVIANGQIRNQGAGQPDFGLYTQAQMRGGEPVGTGAVPERGVIEVKGLADETWITAATPQVSRYWERYGLVLVTNYRSFLLIGRDGGGRPQRLEAFSFSVSDAAFWAACAAPQRAAKQLGDAFVDYLRRTLAYLAPLTRPSDLAWLLASYAREALRRIESHVNLPALATVRGGLEQALGLRFDDAKGEHFFRSTLVQTIFYGIFSAWVQWARERPGETSGRFDWHAAGWSLHVPMVRTLFEQVATPSRLGPLGLVELLDWTGSALNRVDRTAFFAAFDEGLAVQYFYEPFLKHFDPTLRKQLGVWYTPPEIVRYMVERVDTSLRTELGLADGLADPRVHILDPCCGTGSFLVEILRLIADRLRERGEDALLGQDLKQAAMNRVFGFEITPAPFVIAHWQIGMVLAAAGAPLAESERAAVYLTNSLTGWLPPQGPRQRLLMPELEPERDAAERVKRVAPILVIIGNPPYNAFTGVSPEEEEGLVEPYKQGLRTDWGIKKYNLDELYVRFLRVAERRIVEGSGRGIISYVSSYSYLSDPSFVVVRRHLLDGFDSIWIDCLNGDSRETGKRTPSGDPDPSVFSTASNPGIKLGTAVGMFVRQGSERYEPVVRYRDLWGARKREELLESLNARAMEESYQVASPRRSTRYNFRPQGADNDYTAWPDLIALAEAEPFSGLAEMRKGALIDFNRADLEARMRRYLDPDLSFETVRAANVGPVGEAGRFDAEAARKKILVREPFDPARIVRYAILPLDTRFAYHTNVRPIWNEPRPEFVAQAIEGNVFVVSRMMAERPQEGLPALPTKLLPDYHLLRPNIRAFPTRIHDIESDQGDFLAPQRSSRANLSARARQWLQSIGAPDPDADAATGSAPWLHALAICCSPTWLDENHAAILGGWPRFPLPTDLAALRASAALGARIAALLRARQAISESDRVWRVEGGFPQGSSRRIVRNDR